MNQPQRILIVDDRPENLSALERVLRTTNAEITAVGSGNDALVATLENEYALAILDVQMPEMDGYELAELLRSERRTRHLPIIFVSAVYSDDYHVFRGYEAGAVDFLTKPYKPEILLNKVRFFLLLDEQRREIQEKLEIQKSKNYLESILTCMTDAVVVVSDEHRIRMANRAASDLLGYEEDALVGESLDTIFKNRLLPERLGRMERATAPKGIKAEETSLVDKDGEEIPVLLSASVLRDDRSESRGIVLAAMDNRERRHAEKIRNELEAQLRHSQRLESIGRLAGGVAHDFNNLLTVVLSCSRFVADRLRDGDQNHHDVAQIIEAGERAAELVSQLLAFSHKQVLHPVAVDLNAVVGTTSLMLERILGEDITLDTRLSSVSPLAFVDPGQLTQVLMNLAVNARDAMKRGGVLTISTDLISSAAGPENDTTDPLDNSDDRYSRITVRDTGCGMDERTQKHIFEPFFTTKVMGQGTGLGLSVVQGIIEHSGGRISVASVVGEGSVFTIDIPCPAGNAGPAPSEDFAPLPTPGGETVLVVEDDQAVRELTVRILKRHGYDVLEANSTKEAKRLAKCHPEVDLLLSDVIMPGANGPDVARNIREDRPDLPVLFMSGHADDMIERCGMLTDRVSLLQKPFTPSSLVAKITEALRQ